MNDGIRSDSDLDLDTLLTIDVRSLDRIVASLSPQRMNEVEAALKFALALK
jgi:mRNA-degrading endonuclease toxin of MazEF toxin-antitoxin module